MDYLIEAQKCEKESNKCRVNHLSLGLQKQSITLSTLLKYKGANITLKNVLFGSRVFSVRSNNALIADLEWSSWWCGLVLASSEGLFFIRGLCLWEDWTELNLWTLGHKENLNLSLTQHMINHFFLLYGFTSAINHAECWENTRKACKSLALWFVIYELFSCSPNIPRGLLHR